MASTRDYLQSLLKNPSSTNTARPVNQTGPHTNTKNYLQSLLKPEIISQDTMHQKAEVAKATLSNVQNTIKTVLDAAKPVDYDKQLADNGAQTMQLINEYNSLPLWSRITANLLGGKGKEITNKLDALRESYNNTEYEKKRHNTINELGKVYFTGDVNNGSAENVGASIKDTSGIKGIVKYITDPSYKEQVDKNTQNNAGSQFAPTAIAAAIDYEKYTPASFMTDGDKKILTYYANIGDWDSAQKYYNAIKRDLTTTRQAIDSQFMEQFSNEHKAAGTALNITSSIGQPLAYLATVGQNVKNLVTGEYEPIDTSALAFMPSHAVQDTEKGITKDMSVVGKLATDAGLSLGQMAITLLFGKTASLAIMSTGAAGQTALQATLNGASASQALELATIAGVVEYATEKIPLDHLFKIIEGGKQPLAQLLKSSIKQAGMEASEEIVSEYANNVADQLIMGDKSQYNQLVRQYESLGVSEDEAKRKAFLQIYAVNPAMAGGTGFLTGFAGGTGANFIGNISSPKAPNTELNTDSNTTDSTVTPQGGVQATQQAEDAQTPTPPQNAPQANAEGAIVRAREMWRQGSSSSTLFNETGKIVRNDGSVYSESGELQMNANGDIMSPKGGIINAEDEGRYNKVNTRTHGQSISELRRQEIDGRGNISISGGMDQQSGKGWTSLDTGTSKQLTDTFARYVNADPNSELAILKDAFIKQYGSENAAVTEMAKRFYKDLSSSPVIGENRWGNFIPELSELVDSFNRLSAQSSSKNTQIMPGGMGERSGSTYESLSDPRALKLLEQYNSNVPKTEEEKRAELARLYAELFDEQQTGKTAVEKDAAQGYNGNWDRLYDENVQGTGGSNGRIAEGAGDVGKVITEIKYQPSSGVILKANPNKTTTILGSFDRDMKNIVNVMGNVKSTYFGARKGGFNVLNVPDGIYKSLTPEQFWEQYNKRWLDEAIIRGDDIVLATKPQGKVMQSYNKLTGKWGPSGFAREYQYLCDKGYHYDSTINMMVK